MAAIQSNGMIIPNHPVLYGTTLAISLAGSVAALNPEGITLPVDRIKETLGLAGSASAAVPALPPAAAAQAPVQTGFAPAAGENQAALPTKARASLLAAAARPLAVRPQLTTALRMARLDIAKPLPPVALQAEPTAVPQTAPEPAIAAVKESQRNQQAVPPAAPVAAEQPGPSFNEAFQTLPAPALAPAPQPSAVSAGAESAAPVAASPALIAPLPERSEASAPPAALLKQPAVAETAPTALAATAPPAAAPAMPKAAPALAAPANPIAVPLAANAGVAAPTSAPAPAPAAAPLQLVSSPQVRKFDLARIHVAPREAPAALAAAKSKSGRAGAVRSASARDKLVEGVVFHRVTVSVAGSPQRSLELRIGADMKPSIKVGDLLSLVSDRMDPGSVSRFESAASAQEYVSLADLRAAGFNVAYNAGADSISITSGD